MAKLILNIVSCLFIGFTFFKAKHNIQGTQNKLFAIFMATILRSHSVTLDVVLDLTAYCNPLHNLAGGVGFVCPFFLSPRLICVFAFSDKQLSLIYITAIAIGGQQVSCSPVEFVSITLPSGMTCGEYMKPFISFAGGYLTSDCQFSIRTTDQFLNSAFNIFYNHHWRNFGFMMTPLVFNFSFIYLLAYIFWIREGSILPSFKRRAAKK
ncbi:PDR ABC transporter [Laccaria bicolor S238N-H82]|uniref:PDR ABC transporter n=1 Tax=Laccaria bicolor (strain S238N-H82 / ATCC MYA-4686) TaxID=486041 RepID=B0CW14_LACBS|nr:PDR ABC transporter [Laccaria bicolor S238N-H82]EDR13431.1 PDR ABC transporter [Laccaria bicolor S238N-H82]|eukprot:XP_001875929.1 PDR ABC transporter [Laccaria bicolor S238N-H82]